MNNECQNIKMFRNVVDVSLKYQVIITYHDNLENSRLIFSKFKLDTNGTQSCSKVKVVSGKTFIITKLFGEINLL